eukprot:SAG25_NODE_830_length_5160_cov_1179.194626_4_plen_256_part_00
MAPRSPPAAHRAGETFKRLHRLRRRCIQHPRLSTMYPGEPARLHLRACRLPTASGGQHKAQSTKDAAGRQAFLLTSAACLFYSPGGLMIRYETQCAASVRRTQPQFHDRSTADCVWGWRAPPAAMLLVASQHRRQQACGAAGGGHARDPGYPPARAPANSWQQAATQHSIQWSCPPSLPPPLCPRPVICAHSCPTPLILPHSHSDDFGGRRRRPGSCAGSWTPLWDTPGAPPINLRTSPSATTRNASASCTTQLS